MPTILGANTLSGAYDVANSVRFDGASNPYMHKTPGSEGNKRTWTFSTWYKKGSRALAGNDGRWIACGADDNNRDFIYHGTTNMIGYMSRRSGSAEFDVYTDNNYHTDPSAWYHLVVAVDTTQGTAANRVKLYLNGVQITSSNGLNSSTSYPDQNYDTSFNDDVKHWLGRDVSDEASFDGYLAETVLVDGQQLDPTSFGEFDEDSPRIWKPKNVSGLTFGTNGFYLDYEDSSNLGNDASGGTDLTEVNIASTDQSTDTCTNNYATFNPIIPESSSVTFSEGNLKSTGTGGDSWTTHYGVSTIAVSAGKWYVESKVTTTQTSQAIIGILSTSQAINSSLKDVGRATVETSGRITVFGSNAQTSLGAFSDGDIAAIAFDATNGTAQFYRNGSTYGSAVSSIPSDLYYFATTTYDSGGVVEFNFGSPAFSISSGNSDQNGYGNFEYSVPSGYYALNTKNLAEFG